MIGIIAHIILRIAHIILKIAHIILRTAHIILRIARIILKAIMACTITKEIVRAILFRSQMVVQIYTITVAIELATLTIKDASFAFKNLVK